MPPLFVFGAFWGQFVQFPQESEVLGVYFQQSVNIYAYMVDNIWF